MLSLCLIKYHAMKMCRGVEVQLHSLTSALDGGERSTSRTGYFIPVQKNPDTNWIGSRVSPRASLKVVPKTESLSIPGIEHRPSTSYPVTIKKINTTDREKKKNFVKRRISANKYVFTDIQTHIQN
jgi:hypothetical protein